MALTEYKRKRRFGSTPEPAGGAKPPRGNSFVVQEHHATRLHYDFRLEVDGVMKSWAVPKGPSMNPGDKRLAIQTEDHPVEYASFEGVIPEGEYGGGTVMVWDQGTWTPESPEVNAALTKGDLKFTLHGKKLKGSWVLVRTHGWGSSPGKSWLLIKHRDRYTSTKDIAIDKPRSIVSNKLLAEIAREGGGDVEKAATGDPGFKPKKAVVPKKTPAPAKRLSRKSAK